MRLGPIDSTADENEHYPEGRFRALLVILVLLLVLIGVAQRLGLRDSEGPGISEPVLRGDLSLKLAYSYRKWEGLLPQGSPQRWQMEQHIAAESDTAVMQYAQAARETPSPGNLRRLLITVRDHRQGEAIEQLGRIPARRASLRREEVRMWRDIYLSTGELPPARVSADADRIRRLGLGWHEHLALADLYERAGLLAEAERERAEAESEAVKVIGWLLVLLAALGGLGTAGLGLLAWYASRRAGRRIDVSPVPELPSDDRPLIAGCLLETFIAYLIILVGAQVAAVAAVASEAVDVAALGAAGDVLLTTGVYVLAGVLSAAYLAYRLRSAGWTWRTIGLTTRNPWVDVLWGIGGYAAALPMLIAAGLISQAIGRLIPSPTNPIIPLFAETESVAGRVLLFVLLAGAAPFFEELFFRGVLFGSFRAKWGIRLGIVLSAVVFASVHPLPVGFLPILVLGTIFAILVHERQSLLPAMVAHGLNNGVAFALLLILTRT